MFEGFFDNCLSLDAQPVGPVRFSGSVQPMQAGQPSQFAQSSLFSQPAGSTQARDRRKELAQLPTCRGVILFADSAEMPVQLLTAANIRRTATARLIGPGRTDKPDITDHSDGIDSNSGSEGPGKQSLTGRSDGRSRYADISAVVRRIYYLCCHNSFRTALRHLSIAQSIFPDTWGNHVVLPRQGYVCIDLSASWPNFTQTASPVSGRGRGRVFGPFPTYKARGEFIRILREAFGLCCRPDLVDSAEKSRNCPYLQMGTCSGPCRGNPSREKYGEQIAAAVAAAGGDVESARAEMQSQMRLLAGQTRFEQAQQVKKQLETLQIFTKPQYRWTRDLSKLTILHIDSSARVMPEKGKRRVPAWAAFVIRPGQIEELPDFTADQFGSLYDRMAKVIDQSETRASESLTASQMALTGWFLYRSSPPGLWLNCSAALPGREDLENLIRDKFKTKPRTDS